MSISCLALNEEANLRGADIKKDFLIELVIVTESWEIYVPTAKGNCSLKITGEGERIKASLQGDELERADNEEMDPILRSAISQAIRDDPHIGRIWVVQFTLFAAVDAETQNLQLAPCVWYKALATAREKLAGFKGKPKTTYNHHDPSTEQEKSAIPKGGYGYHVVDEYQNQLLQLERRLKEAKHMGKQ